MTRRCITLVAACSASAVLSISSAGEWIGFTDATASRLNAPAQVGSADVEEKDYAWADLDQDGDVDLVVVRKQPFSTPGGRRNVLLMNEAGVLTDRTHELASAANDGGQGFLDATNDRDVAIGDVNGDGWPDVVTCATLGQSQPKTISHPRVYVNLGLDAERNWLGFFYDEPRIPQLPSAPNANGIAIGDVTGDGAADLYLVDAESPLEDRLLINDGTGFFSDQTDLQVFEEMFTSNFATQCAIVDMNGDGVKDLVKNDSGEILIALNDPKNVGFFALQITASSGAHYNFSAGDLNDDGKLDLVASDDGADRYALRISPDDAFIPAYETHLFSLQAGGDDGIAGNSEIADIDDDGWPDVLICDVDVDIGGCQRRLHMYRNLGDAPSVTLEEQGTGGIPLNMLTGSHDVAVFDIDGDGWKDMVLGRCAGTTIWINVPQPSLVFSYPQGLLTFVEPGAPSTFVVSLALLGGAIVTEGSATISVSIDGGPFASTPLTPLGGNSFEATLPAAACLQRLDYFLSVGLETVGVITDPPTAPDATHSAIATSGAKTVVDDEIEGDVSGWTVINAPALTAGGWVAVDPVGSFSSVSPAQPEEDATPGEGVTCWITGQGVAGQSASQNDVDGGPTQLVTPSFDLAGADGVVSMNLWVFCNDAGGAEADFLSIEVSTDDGATWALVESFGTTEGNWLPHSFAVGDFAEPSATNRVRFSIADLPSNSITEAGVDDFVVERLLCEAACPSDLNGDAAVGGADLGLLLAAWGGGGPADLDGSGAVDGGDLGLMLAAWGNCP